MTKMMFIRPPFKGMGRYVPPHLGIATLYNYLHGKFDWIEFSLVDALADALDEEQIVKAINYSRPDILAITIKTMQVKQAKEIIERVKDIYNPLNDEQNNFSFMVTLAANATTKNLSLTVTPNVPSNADSLNYRRFLKKAISAKHIELKSLNQNAVFISSKANLVPHGCEKLDVEIEFLEKIVAIETHYHITLTIPDEIDISDHQIIDRLYSMIRDGKYSGICSGFTMSFNLTEELRQSIRTIGEVACSFSCSLGMHVELFDQKLDFNIIRKIDSMRLDNFEKITKKIDALDNGDPIKVSFVSGNTDPNIHYSDMFYSEETAKNLLKETVS